MGGNPRLGIHKHWVAARVMWTKALPTLLTPFSLSPSLISPHKLPNTHVLTSAGSSLWLTGLAFPNCQTCGSTSPEGGCKASVQPPTVGVNSTLYGNPHRLPCILHTLISLHSQNPESWIYICMHRTTYT